MDLPGEGAIYVSQSLKFKRPVYLEDTIKAEVTVKELIVEKNRAIFECVAYNQNDEVVVVGEAMLMPVKK